MHRIAKPDASSRPSAETLVAWARAMIPNIANRAAAARRKRRVPEETIRDMEEAGFFRILQPARWGGYEMKPQVFYDVLMALAEGDMSTGWVYGVLGVHPWLMGLMGEGSWCGLALHRAGQTTMQNGYIESFNGRMRDELPQ